MIRVFAPDCKKTDQLYLLLLTIAALVLILTLSPSLS